MNINNLITAKYQLEKNNFKPPTKLFLSKPGVLSLVNSSKTSMGFELCKIISSRCTFLGMYCLEYNTLGENDFRMEL